MKNTRFALAGGNRTCASTTTLINGNGGYASSPAKSEDTQYPMTNLALADPLSLWRAANGLTGTYTVEFDMGSDLSLDVFGVLNLRRASGQSSPSTFDVSYRTAALGYSFAGSWTAILTGRVANRTNAYQIAAPVRGRYVRFTLGVGGTGGGFSIGNFYIGNLSYDLGMIYGPGGARHLERQERRYRLNGGALVNNRMGDEAYTFRFPFGAVGPTVRDTLRVISKETAPLVYLSHDDESFCVLPASTNDETHRWIENHDNALDLETVY